MISIVEDIKYKLLAQPTTQYFINGAPGSGKSFALTQLAQNFSEHIPGSIVFGPFAFDLNETMEYSNWLVQQLFNACFIDELSEIENNPEILQNVATTWAWLNDTVHAPNKRFVILLDVKSSEYSSSQPIANFFSALRSLESTNYKRNFNLHHILTGYWDHVSLEDHYRNANVSFPYTVGHNYKHWNGLDRKDVIELLPQGCSNPVLYGSVLHELTGGHAGIIGEILSRVDNTFKLQKILNVINILAQSGETTPKLLSAWRHLPQTALNLLAQMLIYRNIPLYANSSQNEHYLIASGIASTRQIGETHYLSFKSWYAELIVRYHYEDLGIRNERLSRLEVRDISPEINSINVEAYRVIRDIETSARNLVIIALSNLQHKELELLEGFSVRYEGNDPQTLLDKAIYQRDRTKAKGLNTSINPIIAYISTGELAHLIKEIEHRFRVLNWDEIGEKMLKVAAIRNAVMHNQLIDETALDELYDLQHKIYAAFSQLSV